MDKEKSRKPQTAGSESIKLTKVSIGIFLVLLESVHLEHMPNTKSSFVLVFPFYLK